MDTLNDDPKYYVYSAITLAARNLIGYYNRELEPFNLTAQQVMALGVLWKEEKISLGIFASRLGVGKAAAVTMVNRLEGMGYMVRRPNVKDARLNSLQLTDKAKKIAPDILEKIASLEETLEAALGVDNLHILLDNLAKISELKL